jgi:hypothetical protein
MLPLILFIYDSFSDAISYLEPVEGSWEHSSEPPGSIKCWEVFE